MSTLGELKTAVAVALRDPGNKTFTSSDCGDFANAGLSEVSRLSPIQFSEDLTPVDNQFSYRLQSDTFGAAVNGDIEVARVELWDTSQTPEQKVAVIQPAHAGFAADSDSGWSLWNGSIILPRWVVAYVIGNVDLIYRVWGYAPRPTLVADLDVAQLTAAEYQGVLDFARLQGLETLLMDRNLFTQWQARSNATDISPAALYSELNFARDNWRHRAKTLYRPRTGV
jgi:hypothetical protein